MYIYMYLYKCDRREAGLFSSSVNSSFSDGNTLLSYSMDMLLDILMIQEANYTVYFIRQLSQTCLL